MPVPLALGRTRLPVPLSAARQRVTASVPPLDALDLEPRLDRPGEFERRPASSPVLQGLLFLPGSEDLPGRVVEGVAMPVYDLPHVIFPAKYRSDAQRIAM